MAINLVYGKPRSGKSYYVVNHLVSNYYDYDKGIDQWFFKKEYDDYRIVSNVDGLKLPHDDLNEWIKKAGGVDTFFSLEFQEMLFHKQNLKIIYIIDECHKFFPNNYKCNPVFNWISEHAHLGQTIYLMTQTLMNIPRRISDQCEMYLYALPQSNSILRGKELNYNVVDGREIIDRKMLVKRQEIFDLYKSQRATEAEKVKNPMMKYVVGIALVVLFIGWRGYSFISNMGGSSSTANASTIPAAEQVVNQKIELPDSENKTFLPDSYIHFVKLSKITDRSGVVFFLGDHMIRYRNFPFKINPGAFGQFYAEIPHNEYIKYFPDEEKKAEPLPSREGEQASDIPRRLSLLNG